MRLSYGFFFFFLLWAYEKLRVIRFTLLFSEKEKLSLTPPVYCTLRKSLLGPPEGV